MLNHGGFVILSIFTFIVQIVLATREGTHEQMYIDLDINAACFRRLNGTHQFGCSSSKGGNVGIIHIVKNQGDLNSFLQNATSEKYIIALSMTMFTKDVVSQLLTVRNLAGMLLMVQKDYLPDHYSPDDVCPNSAINSCGGQIINPYGNGFLFMDWPFPMFMVDNEETITAITNCFEKFNLPLGESQLTRPLCSLQMKSHMSAAVNTPTCLRRESEASARVYKYCDPMGDRNVILPMIGFQDLLPERSTIVIAARLDSATIFDGVSAGAITSATSIVTLLATAHVLSKMLKDFDVKDKEVIFMLFNGEVQDYIGSSRIIYDIKNGDFYRSTSLNFTLENVMAFIELSQIDADSKFYLHSTKDETIAEIGRKLIAVGPNYSVEVAQSSLEVLPPSTLKVFTKADPTMPGLVIASYDKQYTNKYYNGLLDSSKTLSLRSNNVFTTTALQKSIAGLSTSLASVVYGTITNSFKSVDQDDVYRLVDDLLHCYLNTRLCRLMKEVFPGAEGSGLTSPWPLYVSVQPSLNPITTATGLLLAYLTADPIKMPEEECSSQSKTFSYYWINGPNNTGLCLNTTLKLTPAVSPAFLIENYNWTSGEYSTWTESIWFDFGVSMFLKPSRKMEWITFSIGLMVFFVSFVSVYFLNKNAKDIFSPMRTSCSLLTTNC